MPLQDDPYRNPTTDCTIDRFLTIRVLDFTVRAISLVFPHRCDTWQLMVRITVTRVSLRQALVLVYVDNRTHPLKPTDHCFQFLFAELLE